MKHFSEVSVSSVATDFYRVQKSGEMELWNGAECLD